MRLIVLIICAVVAFTGCGTSERWPEPPKVDVDDDVDAGLEDDEHDDAGVEDDAGVHDDVDAGLELIQFTVPQSRVQSGLREISLWVARYRGTTQTSSSPIVFLMGGPGGKSCNMIRSLSGGSGRRLATLLGRDVLVLFQRGTAHTEPYLDPLLNTGVDNVIRDKIQAYAKSGYYLGNFNTIENAADVAYLTELLGYKRLILWGSSYGTSLAAMVAKRHPEVVESLIMDGTVLNHQSTRNSDRSQLLPSIYEDIFSWHYARCISNPVCSRKYPTHPRQDFLSAIRVLARTPIRMIKDDPTTLLTPHTFINLYYDSMLSARQRPHALLMAYAISNGFGKELFSALEPQYRKAVKIEESISGTFFTIVCFDLKPQSIAGSPIDAYTNASSISSVMNAFFLQTTSDNRAMCAILQSQTSYPLADFHEPVFSNVPALFLAGKLDPATPAVWAQMAQVNFPNSQYVESECLAHGFISESAGCGPSLLRSFTANPERPVDTSCVKRICSNVRSFL